MLTAVSCPEVDDNPTIIHVRTNAFSNRLAPFIRQTILGLRPFFNNVVVVPSTDCVNPPDLHVELASISDLLQPSGTYAMALRLMAKYPRICAVVGHMGNGARVGKPLAEALGVPLLACFGGSDVNMEASMARYRRAYVDMLKSPSVHCVAVAGYLRDKLLELGASPERTFVWHRGCDIDTFGRPQTRLDETGGLKILIAARFYEVKGHQYAVRAFEKVLARVPKAQLHLLGDGPLLDETKELAASLQIASSVFFHGHVDHTDVLQHLRNTDIYMHPSIECNEGRIEGVPNAIMEAHAVGLPVVASRHGGIPEVVVDGKSGFLVAERDVEMLAEKLVLLAEDPQLRQQMGLAGRSHIEQEFNLTIQSRRLADRIIHMIQSVHWLDLREWPRHLIAAAETRRDGRVLLPRLELTENWLAQQLLAPDFHSHRRILGPMIVLCKKTLHRLVVKPSVKAIYASGSEHLRMLANLLPEGRRRVLHVLAYSLPKENGYSIRSSYIVATQREQGRYEPVVVTSPFYPHSFAYDHALINDVVHYRVSHPIDVGGKLCWQDRLTRRIRRSKDRRAARYREQTAPKATRQHESPKAPPPPKATSRGGKLFFVHLLISFAKKAARKLLRVGARLRRKLRLLVTRGMRKMTRGLDGVESYLLTTRYERELIELCRWSRPDIIHAHTPYRCGIPAGRVARKLGIPFVYEVRGLWEESSVASGRYEPGGRRYRYWRKKEIQVMLSADMVTCICQSLKDDIVSRGVDPARVSVIPNGVCIKTFDSTTERHPRDASDPKVEAVRRQLASHTIGYIGSLRALEGVDELVRGFAQLHQQNADTTLLIVGSGPDLPDLKELAKELGVQNCVIFTGWISHEQVQLYYDMIDVFVISRPDFRVTRLVTPLKPIEAMAMRKALVVSDLPALREIVNEGETGLIYEVGNPSSLAEKCLQLIQDDDLRERLAEAAMKWARQRAWPKVLQQLSNVYEAAREHHRQR